MRLKILDMATKLPEELIEKSYQLEPDALRVLTSIASRLVHGQSKYGAIHIATDRREWVRETIEEIDDALVYVRLALLKIEDASKKAGDQCEPSKQQERPCESLPLFGNDVLAPTRTGPKITGWPTT